MDNSIPSPPSIPPVVTPKTGFRYNILLIIVGFIIAVLAGTGGYILGMNSNKSSIVPITVTPTIQQRACTDEAKICPDGTAVGRTGPNCEFAPCPSVDTATASSHIEDTLNWKIYTNSMYGYSFKYPSNWKYITREDDIFFNDSEYVDSSHYLVALLLDHKNYVELKSEITKEKTIFQLDGRESVKHMVYFLRFTRMKGELPDPSSAVQEEGAYEVLIPISSGTLRMYSILEAKSSVEKILTTFKFIY